MLDDSLLDDPEALAAGDRGSLLRGAAEAGALTRTATRLALEAGLAELQPDGRPRALLVAGPGPTTQCVADLLGALTNGAVPVTALRPTGSDVVSPALRWTLPGWSGPYDLLLIVTPEGNEPGLVSLAEQAYHRGCTVTAVAPPRSPLAEATGAPRGLVLPLAEAPYVAEAPYTTASPETLGERPAVAPGTLWALLTPLLLLTDRLGLTHTPPEAAHGLADRLDVVAERCGPAAPTYANPAKSLALELAESLPLLWSETVLGDAVGRHFATMLGALPGRPALCARLPEALLAHRMLVSGEFAGGSGVDDIFRDRVEEPASLRALIVLLHEQTPGADSAAPAARELAHGHSTGITELEVPEQGSPLEAAAELIATADFTTVYLSLTHGP